MSAFLQFLGKKKTKRRWKEIKKYFMLPSFADTDSKIQIWFVFI